jgi:X-Pro dipeptidyl-peptidase
MAKGEPLAPGKFYDLTFDLQPGDRMIPPGKQLAVLIMSSDRTFTLWPQPGTELTVDLAKTALTLPVVGGQAAYRRATGK